MIDRFVDYFFCCWYLLDAFLIARFASMLSTRPTLHRASFIARRGLALMYWSSITLRWSPWRAGTSSFARRNSILWKSWLWYDCLFWWVNFAVFYYLDWRFWTVGCWEIARVLELPEESRERECGAIGQLWHPLYSEWHCIECAKTHFRAGIAWDYWKQRLWGIEAPLLMNFIFFIVSLVRLKFGFFFLDCSHT